MDIFASSVGSGPHGLEVVGEELFACSGSRLKAYNLVSEEQTVNINLGASFANGITHKGNDVFVTDFSGKDIYPELADKQIMAISKYLATRSLEEVGSILVASKDGDFTLTARAFEENYGYGIVRDSKSLLSWLN